ncbi:ABC transporter substrate-binding protein [Chelativorans sp.]|uniref:heme/hemin ABC transporter substrate-binding protein n=1 Tax=Chelativorans sp. TaxID=2203393 RepID=UPI002811DCFB|nr:ABC transporter substrate-binding protein [Chelativorans sp.]
MPELLRLRTAEKAALAGFALLMASFLPAGGTMAEDLPQALPDPSRLVTIGGSLTEIVFALGEEKRLVGRDSTSTYPPEAAEIPDVGYMRQLAPEGVLSVAPTGIIALHGSGPPEAMDVLGNGGIPLVVVPESYDRDGILRKIRFVGAALGSPAKAEELAERVGREIDTAEALTQGVAERKRVLFILSMQGGRILASGTGTAADGVIEMAGGVNAIDSFAGYKKVSEEAVIQAQPDVILMMDRGGEHGASGEDFFAHPAIAPTPAGQSRTLVRMDGSYLLGFGPRTAAAVRDLAAALYPTPPAN